MHVAITGYDNGDIHLKQIPQLWFGRYINIRYTVKYTSIVT